jgi:hypothetical protein
VKCMWMFWVHCYLPQYTFHPGFRTTALLRTSANSVDQIHQWDDTNYLPGNYSTFCKRTPLVKVHSTNEWYICMFNILTLHYLLFSAVLQLICLHSSVQDINHPRPIWLRLWTQAAITAPGWERCLARQQTTGTKQTSPDCMKNKW